MKDLPMLTKRDFGMFLVSFLVGFVVLFVVLLVVVI